MLTKEEVIELKKNIEEMQLQLLKHHIEELLHKYGVECGEKISYLGKMYQILDMEQLVIYNRQNNTIQPYGKLIKKNGELGNRVHKLYDVLIKKVKE